MTYGEIEQLLEEHKPVLCVCGNTPYASLMQRWEGYIRLRCSECDTDMLLASWVLDLISLEATKKQWEAEQATRRAEMEKAHKQRVRALRERFGARDSGGNHDPS